MPFKTFATCLSKMPAGAEMSFAGFAEPWLNNRATDMAEEANRQGRTWEIYTTCVGMSEKDVDRIVAAQPIRIKLHLPDTEGYAKIRVDEQYVRVVKRLADKFPVNVMTMGTLPQVLLQRFGKIHAAAMHTRAGNVDGMEKLVPLRKRGPLRCRPGPKLDRNILIPDGKLILCCADFSMQHVIGNLLKQSWQDIMDGPALTAIRKAMASENGDVLCRQCEFSEPCT
jgi:radical SAM protein with 4Fe4S-binding SPASM domain